MKVDYSSLIKDVANASLDENGDDFFVEGYSLKICLSYDEVDALLSAYDPTSSTSPSAADSRIIARAILNALKKYKES